MGERGEETIPYCFDSLISEFHVSLGLTSNMFPNNGTPGGLGISEDILGFANLARLVDVGIHYLEQFV